jgi:hypothetical protein
MGPVWPAPILGSAEHHIGAADGFDSPPGADSPLLGGFDLSRQGFADDLHGPPALADRDLAGGSLSPLQVAGLHGFQQRLGGVTLGLLGQLQLGHGQGVGVGEGVEAGHLALGGVRDPFAPLADILQHRVPLSRPN